MQNPEGTRGGTAASAQLFSCCRQIPCQGQAGLAGTARRCRKAGGHLQRGERRGCQARGSASWALPYSSAGPLLVAGRHPAPTPPGRGTPSGSDTALGATGMVLPALRSACAGLRSPGPAPPALFSSCCSPMSSSTLLVIIF